MGIGPTALVGYNDGGQFVPVSSANPLPISGSGGGGGGIVGADSIYYTGSSKTVSATSFTVIDATWDMTLPASEGDTIQVGLSLRPGFTSSFVVLDFRTMVSGSPVNSITTGSAATSTLSSGAIAGWSTNITNMNLSASHFYNVQSADIVDGNITLRLFAYRGANNVTISSPDPAVSLFAINFGAVG